MSQVTWRSSHLEHIHAGEIRAKWNSSGYRILRYYIDFRNDLLGVHKELSAADLHTLQSKVDALMDTWERRAAELTHKQLLARTRSGAENASSEAAQKIARLAGILAAALRRSQRVDWEGLKDRGHYEARTFSAPRPILKKSTSPDFVPPTLTFADKLFGRGRKKMAAAEAKHGEALRDWASREQVVEDMHAADMKAWDTQRSAHEIAESDAKYEFERHQAEANSRLDAIRQGVVAGDPNSVVEQVLIVLDRSDYDGLFEIDYSVDYDAESKSLFIDYELPSPEQLPIVKSVKFSPTTGEITETYISEREQKANYDSTCYQIALRTMHEVFTSDEHANIDLISFNGFASSVDRATGRDVHPCILSVVVARHDFEGIDLARVEPKACFKSLKGVSASSLAALAPVPPLMQMDRNDKRFVEARDMSSVVDEGTNLAAMSWEDFEHLVRQLFERVFAGPGSEVRITQASRDGGVDAVVFDPDPIRGGKIVIQAKRYTRAVGVSAVRDLYGTLMNEGASKGILVTTADYGPDAYSFANGKPITLISGAQLLYMLGQHGFRARIDIAEARKLLGPISAETY